MHQDAGGNIGIEHVTHSHGRYWSLLPIQPEHGSRIPIADATPGLKKGDAQNFRTAFTVFLQRRNDNPSYTDWNDGCYFSQPHVKFPPKQMAGAYSSNITK